MADVAGKYNQRQEKPGKLPFDLRLLFQVRGQKFE